MASESGWFDRGGMYLFVPTRQAESRVERCVSCDGPTGRAGRYDDSLYDGNGDGPYCEECYEPKTS